MTDLRHDEAGERYLLNTDAGPAVAAYTLDGDRATFTHTEVPEAVEGEGIGSRLVAGALADARSRGWRVVARCPFVAAYIRRHPDAAPGTSIPDGA